MEKTYAHVGYPKCASTSLQAFFFSQHPELYHLGVSGGGTTPPYIDDDVRLAIEVDFRLSQDFFFDLAKTQEVFSRHYEDFERSGRKLFGISSESFTTIMHNELDITQKASRLHRVLGPDTKIIMVLRNQPDLMRSIYKEWIYAGVFFTYNEFWRTLLENSHRSLIATLDFAQMYALYCGLFGQDNVLVLPLEQLRNDQAGFLAAICDHLDISRHACTEIGTKNESMSEECLEMIRKMNFQNRHNMGRTVIESVNAYRNQDYFTKRLGIPVPASVMNDLDILQYHMDFAAENIEAQLDSPKLDWSMQPWLQNVLFSFFAESNKALQQSLGDRLDLAEYGYIGTS